MASARSPVAANAHATVSAVAGSPGMAAHADNAY